MLVPVYRELGLDWSPSTAGAADDFVPGVTVDDVLTAVVEAFSERFDLVAKPMPEAIVRSGLELAPAHISPG